MTYVIAGATGHIGGAIARSLLSQGHRVRGIGREPERLRSLVELGAESAHGDLGDAVFLTTALRGATAVFLLVPPNFRTPDFRAYQNAVGASLASSLTAAGLPPTVFLSSIGAHQSYDVGPVSGLHDVEQRLNALSGMRVLHLRPGYFFENLLNNLDVIRRKGINGTPCRGDAPIPMIGTADIAAVAVRYLLTPSFAGVSFKELQGPRDYTMVEATKILGAAIGKPDLAYVQFPEDAAVQAMISAGLTPDLAALYVELYRLANRNGRWATAVPRSPTTPTPTTLEHWAATDFAAAWRASA